MSRQVRYWAMLLLSGTLQAAGPGPEAMPKEDELAVCRNFVFFGSDRHRIVEPDFAQNPGVAGAQLRYTWRELEPERDRYDFRKVEQDLDALAAMGKRLWVQLQDVSFGESIPVPEYLLNDPAFGGGAARKYAVPGDNEGEARFDGWVARRWDPAVRERFEKLLRELGKTFDRRIEGLNLAETAIDFGTSGSLSPSGFSPVAYVDAVKSTMSAARRAFAVSHVIIYANFMPGEWRPWTDRGFLQAVYAHAEAIGVGVGGPDLLPHRKGQQQHSLPLIAGRRSGLTAGLAVQDGNLSEVDPATGDRVTVGGLYRFARERLRLDYIFWGTEEPYYSREVLPFLRRLHEGRAADASP